MSQTDTHSHDAPHEHVEDSSVYLRTLIILLFLTLVTVGASYIQFGSPAANVAIALFIATIKAILVGLFFMHLAHDKPVNGIIAMAGFIFLGIFLMFDLIDFDSRNNYMPFNYTPVVSAEPIPGASPKGPEVEKGKEGKEGEKAPAKAEEKK